MFAPFARLIATLSVRPSRRDRRRGLRCEHLEDRTVPGAGPPSLPEVSIAAISNAVEGGADGVFRVSRTGDTSADLTVTYTVPASGAAPATPGDDYAALSLTVTILAGNASADILVDAPNDGLAEDTETVTVTLDPSASYTLGTDTATLNILDGQVVSVARTADAVEGGADGTFRFSRTGDLSQSLTVYYTVETSGDGAATPGTDYTALTGSVTIPAYAEYADVTVDAGTDALIEGPEWVSLSIDTDSNYLIDWADSAAVFITDKTREVSVEGIQDTVEDGADGILRFTRTGDLTDPLTVTYTVLTTGPALATSGSDFTALTGTVTFAAYSATADVTIVTIDDGVREPDEAVMVSIDASEYYTIGVGSGQVWIADDDGAAMYWISDDAGDWWDPLNWSANREPEPEDDLYFTGSHNGDMTGFDTETSPLSYASIHVIDDYTGTITLTVPVSLGALEMASDDAVLDQPLGEDSALTVTAYFDWTGGTINESVTASTVTLSGAVAELAPSGGGTVSSGSSFSLISGSILTAFAGTLRLLNDDLDIDIGEYCGLVIDPEEDLFFQIDGFSQSAAGTRLQLNANGWADVRKSGAALYSTRLINSGGQLILYPNTSLYIAGAVDDDRAYVQWGGFTHLHSGSVLLAGGDKEIEINGGDFRVITSNGRAEATVTTAHFTFNGAELTIGSVAQFPVTGKLTVFGDALWLSGVYRPVIVGDLYAGISDRWIVTGDLTVDGGTLTPLVVSSEGDPMSPVNSGEWDILEADDITKTSVAYNQAVWSLAEVGAPLAVTEWTLVAN